MAKNTRERILDASEKLFTNRRFHEVKLEDIAKAAGIGKGTIYNYFSDKDDLFFQTVTRGFQELCEIIRNTLAQKLFFQEKMEKISCDFCNFLDRKRPWLNTVQNHESYFDVMCKNGLNEEFLRQKQELENLIAEFFASGQKQGLLKDNWAASILAQLFLGMMRIKALNIPPQESFSVAEMLQVFLGGIGTRKYESGP